MWGPVTPAQIGRYLPIQSELIQEFVMWILYLWVSFNRLTNGPICTSCLGPRNTTATPFVESYSSSFRNLASPTLAYPSSATTGPGALSEQGLRLRKTSGSEALSVRKSFVVSLTLLLRVIWP
jgi:hypothetical protein